MPTKIRIKHPAHNQGTARTRKYTVVGHYCDEAQRFCFHVEALNPTEAVKAASLIAAYAALDVAGVFEGHHYAVDEVA